MTTEVPAPGHVVLRRYMDSDRKIILSIGNFADFLAAHQSHVELWDKELDGLSHALIRQGLAGGVLHLSNVPRDESFGLTIHLHKPPTNVFIAGDSPESSVTGRVYTEGVKTQPSSRLYLQSQRPKREPTQSILEVQGFDVLEYLESYYLNSEQRHGRFFEIENDLYDEKEAEWNAAESPEPSNEASPDKEAVVDEAPDRVIFMQVLSLPDSDPELFGKLTPRTALDILDDHPTLLEERVFFFQCGCTPQRMLQALRGVFAGNPGELFLGDERVETHCPRCGRRWWVTREEFEGTNEDEDGDADAGGPGGADAD